MARYLLPLLPPPPGKLRTIPRPLRLHHRLLRMLREAKLLSKDSNRRNNQHRNQGNKDNGVQPALHLMCKTGRFRRRPISRELPSRVILKPAPVHPGVLPIRLIQTARDIRTTKRLKFLPAL